MKKHGACKTQDPSPDELDYISKSKYRTIYKGFDNESGQEIAWSIYSLTDVSAGNETLN